MASSIKNPRTEQLARAVARETGESLTQGITVALEERLARLRGRRTADLGREAVAAILQQCRGLPDLDTRSPDEILDADQLGRL